MPELTYREAVRDALSTAMRQDDDVFIMGEDIAEMGGSMGVTAGMLEEFGKERVRNTPISEMALAGTAIGAAMQGMRPVAEIMYEDFMTLAAEQVVNQAAKLRYMSGGQLTVPVVFRTQAAPAGRRARSTRSSSRRGSCTSPGLKVVFASTPKTCAAPLVGDLRRQPRRLLRAPDALPDQGQRAAGDRADPDRARPRASLRART
jgi:pyruvate dehydrogenase E1 component beta subunit